MNLPEIAFYETLSGTSRFVLDGERYQDHVAVLKPVKSASTCAADGYFALSSTTLKPVIFPPAAAMGNFALM